MLCARHDLQFENKNSMNSSSTQELKLTATLKHGRLKSDPQSFMKTTPSRATPSEHENHPAFRQQPRYRWGSALLALALAGCAFDVSHVTQKPAALTAATEASSFVLLKEVKARLGTGYPTILKANTTWRQVGTTELGRVYSTPDQVVKVEASNIYEAYIVVANGALAGFYLPVEKSVVPLDKPLPLEFKTQP